MSHEDQVYELKTAEFAADGDECVRRDDAARIARAADAEIAKLRAENARLQSGIATLRADLINRRNVLVRRFRSVAAHQGAYMLPEIAVIEDVLRALGALVPEEKER
jgi:hypothetical protein